LEVTVAFVGFFLAFLVVRMSWVWRVLECSPELVALLGSVVALQVPQALLFQQVFEAVGGLLQVIFCRALDSRDCVVWLELAIRTRVVVVATALIPVVVAAARILLALAANDVVLSVRLVFFVGPSSNHVFELGNGARAAATEIFESVTVVETVLEKVNDFLVGDIDYSGTLVEKASHVFAQGLVLFLLHHGQVHASTRASHGTRKVAGELLLELVPLVDRVLSSDSSHLSGAWSRQKGK
jgi:hypothetical protein